MAKEELKEKDVVAEAQAVLQQKEQENGNAFLTEYQELCKKYGVGLGAVMTLRDGNIAANLEIVKV